MEEVDRVMVQRETKGECLLWMFAVRVCVILRPLSVHFLNQTTFFISFK